MNVKQHLSGLDRALIIHHWDTDGICSASLLKDELGSAKVVNCVPKIGTYRITERILVEARKGWDAIIVADIRLPDEDLRSLRQVADEDIFFFDHHIGQAPPGTISVRENFAPDIGETYPSTSWMVKEVLQLAISLPSLLGIVGDKGSFQFSNRQALLDIERFLSREKLDLDTLAKISNLLDSSARVGDESLVETSVSLMSQAGGDVNALLRHPALVKNEKLLEDEIGRRLQEPEETRDGVVVKEVHSKFDVVSPIARRMAWSGKYRIVVALNSGFLPDRDQLYVRKGTGRLDSLAIIQMAHERGFSAGGKEEVVGVVVPKSETEDFLHQLLSKLG